VCSRPVADYWRELPKSRRRLEKRKAPNVAKSIEERRDIWAVPARGKWDVGLLTQESKAVFYARRCRILEIHALLFLALLSLHSALEGIQNQSPTGEASALDVRRDVSNARQTHKAPRRALINDVDRTTKARGKSGDGFYGYLFILFPAHRPPPRQRVIYQSTSSMV
jgi:hypothetical protein